MTTLEAVNRILRAIGETPAAVLDTGGTSIVGQAEAALNQWQDDLLSTGWHCNTDLDVTLYPPDVSIAVAGGAGTFLVGETVTESVSGATGQFYQLVGTTPMQLRTLSGTFTGGQTLTGGSSGATRTGGALSPLSSGEIVLHRDTLSIAPWEGLIPFSVRAGKLYDTVNHTTTWSSSVRVDRVMRLAFSDCQHLLQAYVVAYAAVEFARQIQGSDKIDRMVLDELAAARAKWHAQDTRESQANFIADRRSLGIRGISWMPVETRRNT